MTLHLKIRFLYIEVGIPKKKTTLESGNKNPCNIIIKKGNISINYNETVKIFYKKIVFNNLKLLRKYLVLEIMSVLR